MHQLFTSRSRRSQQQWPWAILLLLIVLASPALLSPVESAGIAALDPDSRDRTATTPSPNDLDRESDPSTGPFRAPAAETHSHQPRFSTNRPHDTLAVDPTAQQQRPLYQDLLSMPIPPPPKAGSREGGQEVLKKSKKLPSVHEKATTSSKAGGATGSFRSPEPIVYQYTLYYPGNMPLVITAGHGGAINPGKVVSRRMTHHFTPVSDLGQDRPLTVESFSQPVQDWEKLQPEETMPWMPPRDQTKGGNFKRDLNTHAMALNVASAVSCLANGPSTKQATSTPRGNQDDDAYPTGGTNPAEIPPRCLEKGSWGDDASEYPFPAWTTAATGPTTATPAPSASATNSPVLTTRSQKRMRHPNQKIYYPHVIVFRIHRTHVDVNRNITGENAIAEGSPTAEAAWREYHGLIDHVQSMVITQQRAIDVETSANNSAQDQVENAFADLKGRQNRLEEGNIEDNAALPPSARGLLLDIHGHAHSTNLIEIGYLLDGSILGLSDARLDANARNLTEETSIRSLITYLREEEDEARRSLNFKSHLSTSSSSSLPSSPGSPPPTSMSNPTSPGNGAIPFSKWIRGAQESMGGMLQVQGLSSVPSPQNPSPCNECVYFFGGYTIQQHGTRDREDALDAIQLELPKTVRLVDKEEGREMGMRIGRAVVEYMRRYYDFSSTAATSTKGLGLLEMFKEMTPDQARRELAFQHKFPQQHIHRHVSPATIPSAVAQDDEYDNSGDSENEQMAGTRIPNLNRQSSSRL